MKGNTPDPQRETTGAVNSCCILYLWPGNLCPVGAWSGQHFQLKTSGAVHMIRSRDIGQANVHAHLSRPRGLFQEQ